MSCSILDCGIFSSDIQNVAACVYLVAKSEQLASFYESLYLSSKHHVLELEDFRVSLSEIRIDHCCGFQINLLTSF